MYKYAKYYLYIFAVLLLLADIFLFKFNKDWGLALFLSLIGISIAFVSLGIAIGSGEVLRQEAAELRRLTTLVLRSLEETGLVKLNRDASGKIKGLVVRLRAKLSGRGSMSAKGEVIRRESSDRGMTKEDDAGQS
jgi:membrane-bound ClpP family serine protease